MPLAGFRLIKDLHPLRQDAALMRCTHGTLVVLAVIPRALVEQHFWRASLTQEELDQLVVADIGAFGLVVLAKYRRGEIGSWRGFGRTLPVVTFTLTDIQAVYHATAKEKPADQLTPLPIPSAKPSSSKR